MSDFSALNRQTPERIRKLTQKLYFSKMRILLDNGFFGYLLLQMKFVFTNSIANATAVACTDGESIFFNPDMLEAMEDDELDFVVMHEVMHVVLKHASRSLPGVDGNRMNVAMDIVVNSNIMYAIDKCCKEPVFSHLGVPMHLTPGGAEGYLYSAEEVYAMLGKDRLVAACGRAGRNRKASVDSHEKFIGTEAGDDDSDAIDRMVEKACEYADRRDKCKSHGVSGGSFGGRGLVPACVRRIIEGRKASAVDWRTVLNDFVQKAFSDYDWTFMPPDARYGFTDFYLPGFNADCAAGFSVGNVFFAVDVSGSMSMGDVSRCYSEVLSAVLQLEGRIDGYFGCFDADMNAVVKFSGMSDLDEIEFVGGGGTDFGCIFRYIKENMRDEPPAAVIVLTDGKAPCPTEEEALRLPVLWVMTSDAHFDFPYGRTVVMRKNPNRT